MEDNCYINIEMDMISVAQGLPLVTLLLILKLGKQFQQYQELLTVNMLIRLTALN